ncbi:hypothetical protein MIMGU_mgv1a0021141mg, partial [Erythranthe guttata]
KCKIPSCVNSQHPLRSRTSKAGGGTNAASPVSVNTASRKPRYINFAEDEIWCREASVRETFLRDK